MKILAIDIGSSAVKALVMESRFSRFQVSFHDVVAVPDALEPFHPGDAPLSPGQVQALQAIQERHASSVDRIVTNLPFSLYGARHLSFPFRERRKVVNAVKFAIEDEIPFNVEDCVVSSHIYPAGEKDSLVLTAYAPYATLEPFVICLDQIGLPAAALVPDDAVLASLLLREKSIGRPGVAVLNLGHRRSTIQIFRDGVPVMQRTSMFGGYHLTQAIAQARRTGMREAEVAKLEEAALSDDHSDPMTRLLLQALSPLLHDFHQGLMAYSSRYSGEVDQILLAGGTSLLPGLPEYLSALWNKRVEHLHVSRMFPSLSISPQKESEVLLPVTLGLGLTQISGDSRSLVNLRGGRLRLQTGSGFPDLTRYGFAFKVAGSVYAVACLSFLVQSFLLDRQISNRDLRLDQALKAVVGPSSGSFLSILKSSPTRLKGAVEEKVREAGPRAAQPSAGGVAVLDSLDRLSGRITKTTPTEIRKLEALPTSITYTMEAPSEEAARAAAEAAKGLPGFKSASPTESANRGRKRFALSFQPEKTP
ncbi:MAG: pilus assembly protein PilM [Bdellovibrionales bacterium]|nr:pilus assembly protein PilM [Bdellovibrionales bacterium]